MSLTPLRFGCDPRTLAARRLENSIQIALFSVAVVLLGLANPAYAQLLQWNTFGNAGTETTEPSTFNATGIAASNLTLGAGVTPAADANRFGGSAWFDTGNSVPSTLAQAISGNDYIEFMVVPIVGTALTATGLTFSWDHDSVGPSSLTIRTSLDGFASNVGSSALLPAALSVNNHITISGVTNVTSTVTFRIYGYGALFRTGAGGFDTNTNATNVQLDGSVTTVPEPTTMVAGVIAVGALGWHQRRRFSGLRRRTVKT